VHRQIAAMARQKTPIYTTNFDPLFEKALAESSDAGEWLEHRHPGAGRFPAIQHIHGWVDPDGHTEGDVILAESQYFELAARPLALANTKLLEVFRGPLDAAGFPVGGGSLILGMSLSDANLRRILYFLSLGSLENAGPIRAVIQEDDPLLLGYADKHWRSRGLDLIPVRKFAEISTILRDIRYGVPADGQPQAWIEDSARSLKGIPIFDNGWQDQKHHRLAELRERIRTLFAIHNEEVVQLTFFVPLQPHQLGAGVKSISPEEYRKSQYQLYPILSSRKCRTGEAAQTYAADRQHNVNRGTANLIAAAAFVTGNIEEAFDDGGGDETGVFGPFKRDWRSALAVPMLARGEWVPSAVLLLTSNVAEPFWRRFGDRHDRYFSQLINEIDEAARRVLVS